MIKVTNAMKIGSGLLFMCLIFPVWLCGQQLRNIRGNIIDGISKKPLVGALVKVKGTNRSISSVELGRFEIKAATGESLEISFIGYHGKTVVIGNSSTYNVSLEPLEQNLDEVVVVGYGQQISKQDLTGAVSQVKMKDIEKAPVPNIDQALQGRVAGVQVSGTDGQPGEGLNIVIRGGNSLTQDNSPLYVVDGFPMEDFASSSLNPDDIESISILKDASSTSIYGARGANGVVLIETKKGKIGAPVITFNNSLGVQQVQKTIEMMNPYEFVKYQTEMNMANAKSMYLDSMNRTLEDYREMEGIDWQDQVFRNSLNRIHNLGIRGGTGQTKYAISGSANDQNGIIINTGYQRYQGRMNLDQAIGQKLKVGLGANYTRRKTFGGVIRESDGATITSYLMSRVWAYRPISGSGSNLLEEDMDADAENQYDARFNPVVTQNNAYNLKYYTDFMTNGYIDYRIIPELNFKSTLIFSSNNFQFDDFYSSKTPQGTNISYFNSKGVNAAVNNGERKTFSTNNTLHYNKTFNKVHKVYGLAGIELQTSNYKSYGFSVQQLPNEKLGMAAVKQGLPLDIRSIWTEYSLFSFFGRVDYSYKSKYILTGTLRADGSSKFSPENRWGYFPAAAVAWNIHQEDWFKGQKLVNTAKIRMSYGMNGNNRIGEYTRYPMISLPVGNAYSWGNESPTLGAVMTSLPSQGIKWETTENVDMGLDLSFFKGRLEVIVDLYRKNTRDLLMNTQIPTSQGFSFAMKNIGSIRNEGLELTLSSTNLKKKDFTWTTDFNISFNRSKILSLNGDQDKLLSFPSFISQYGANPLYISEVGRPVGMFYGLVWEGTYKYEDFDSPNPNVYTLKNTVPNNGTSNVAPGDVKYRDINGDFTIDNKDLTIIGRGLPIHIGGINNQFTYKGLSLAVFFQWSYGNDVYNANRLHYEGNGNVRTNLNQYASYADRWSPENPDSDIFRANGQGVIGWHSSRVLEDGSYIRLKTVSLDYLIPVRWVKAAKLKGLSIGVAGQNLITWTKYSGMDPEVSVRNATLMPGFDFSAYPMARTIVGTLKATF
ncbi:SusC/RagA family TonB-linked outer membrane protein [Sphingobacterium humi]|uniref:SusC/RagA family TonB-linked outer membrane protein n=1 Tax=Sphingobacterium humi TaxID=1796905 RepID=A0A6N8KZM8_9SPHI|nr:TonB-dependent receptor [Sphingobacterium humi]MVZ62527.1 SusC/RagA family TonB-linked outer membrane protein [Sphingobacterium humi]